jgi:Zn(2)-Cys(6) binuclear cluster domain-containing protein
VVSFPLALRIAQIDLVLRLPMSSRKRPPLPLPPLPPSGQERSPRPRALRKGTLSCWECKRRKTKCTFAGSSADGSCDGCRRRGVSCVSQEFPDVSNTKQHIGERLGRVERLVSQLADKTESNDAQDLDRQDVEPEAPFTQPATRCRQSEQSSSFDRLLRRRHGAVSTIMVSE